MNGVSFLLLRFQAAFRIARLYSVPFISTLQNADIIQPADVLQLLFSYFFKPGLSPSGKKQRWENRFPFAKEKTPPDSSVLRVEMRGVEPLSKSSPTFKRLQFISL